MKRARRNRREDSRTKSRQSRSLDRAALKSDLRLNWLDDPSRRYFTIHQAPQSYTDAGQHIDSRVESGTQEEHAHGHRDSSQAQVVSTVIRFRPGIRATRAGQAANAVHFLEGIRNQYQE